MDSRLRGNDRLGNAADLFLNSQDIDNLADTINDPPSNARRESNNVFDTCEWNSTKLIQEIVSNLESLQGASVDWGTKWPSNNEHLVLLITDRGKEFQVEIKITEGSHL